MIETKQIEIRDEGTCIPAIAVRVFNGGGPKDYILERGGWGDAQYGTYLFPLSCSAGVQYDPYKWPANARTYRVAHEHIRNQWNVIEDGGVVCVEHILGERDTPKESERTVAL